MPPPAFGAADLEQRLPAIFESLENKGWLKLCPRPGLVWAGLGPRVSFEVARAMKRILTAGAMPEDGGLLTSSPGVAGARLDLDTVRQEYRDSLGESGWCDRILDPEKPVTLVLTGHQGCSQQSDEEADLLAALACRLISGHGISPDRMAIITPHRTQNNEILKRLSKMITETGPARKGILSDRGLTSKDFSLPLVDTVERVQGAERDIIFFGLTASDPDHLTSEFLNSPTRLNVAMTRARKKLIIVGSRAFFSVIPQTESLLAKNSCFKQLLSHCRERDAVFSTGGLHHSSGSGMV